MGDILSEAGSGASKQERPFQFRLIDVLLGMAWLAGLLAIVTQVNVLDGMPLFLIAWCAVPLIVANRRGLLSIGQAAVVWCVIVIPIGLVIPNVSAVRRAGQIGQCQNNMKQIALALRAYENTYGCLPPAYIADAQGNPMHSWRVLILPFTDNDALYSAYRFTEPWDGPNNRKLHKIAVPWMCCPNDGKNPTDTNYLAVVGPGTAWPGSTSVKYDMVRDGLSNTLLLVEVANSGIHWMEPRDLPVSALSAGINPPNAAPGSAISSEHPADRQRRFHGRADSNAERFDAH